MVKWNHPFAHRHNPLDREYFFRSSGLKPEVPTVTSASLLGDKCEIKLKFPDNVDVIDTYDHFVSNTRSIFESYFESLLL